MEEDIGSSIMTERPINKAGNPEQSDAKDGVGNVVWWTTAKDMA